MPVFAFGSVFRPSDQGYSLGFNAGVGVECADRIRTFGGGEDYRERAVRIVFELFDRRRPVETAAAGKSAAVIGEIVPSFEVGYSAMVGE